MRLKSVSRDCQPTVSQLIDLKTVIYHLKLNWNMNQSIEMNPVIHDNITNENKFLVVFQ